MDSLKVAVAVSCTALELMRELRVVGALNESLLTHNFRLIRTSDVDGNEPVLVERVVSYFQQSGV